MGELMSYNSQFSARSTRAPDQLTPENQLLNTALKDRNES